MLSASAAAARVEGYETTICFSEVARNRPWLEELDGLADIRFIERTGIRGVMRQLSRVLSEGNGSPVVLHTHFGTFDEAAALLGIRRRHTAVLSHLHSGNPRPVRLRSKAYGAAMGHLVDGVICVSREVYDQARARAVPASKLILLPNAIDPDRFPAITPDERAQARRALNLAPEAEVVVHFAWDWHIKGGDRLLAVADAMATRPNATFLTVLSEHRAGVPADELERRPNVRALGPRDNVNELYAAADAFLNCSRAEGGPPLRRDRGTRPRAPGRGHRPTRAARARRRPARWPCRRSAHPGDRGRSRRGPGADAGRARRSRRRCQGQGP